MTAAKSDGSWLAIFNEEKISDKTLGFNCLSEPEGGVYSIQKLVIRPTSATIVQKMEAKKKSRPVISRTKDAKKVPKIIARKVKDVIKPLAPEILSAGTSSGKIPYFDGPKKALCAASKNKTM